MAYQFADGFDNYGNAFVMVAGYPWDTISGTPSTSTAIVRFAPPSGLPGASLGNGGNSYVRKNLTGNQGTLIIGFGIRLTALPASGTFGLASFWDAGTIQTELAVTSTGALQFYRGGAQTGGTAIGAITTGGTFLANTWYGMALQVTFAGGSSGSVQLTLNGASTPIISSTGLNTISTANSYANQVSIGDPGGLSAATSNYDDFYCFDTTGGFLNAPLGGDARIITKMPNGAGNYTNWTPNGLGSNFQNAAVQPPSTTDYNANNVSTTKDSYAMQSAGLGVAPYFVMARASMERDDAGPHTPSIFVRSSTTDSAGVVTTALPSSYAFFDAVFQNDPATNAIWTGAGADNAQVGVIEG